MAIIYSYPPKPSPSLSDQVLITDSESDDPNNATRNTTVGEILAQKGTGTAGTIPKWLNSNILTDSFIITSGNNMSIPGYVARTGFPDTYFGYEAAGNSKSIALVSNGTQTVRSISDGTNSYGWLGYNGVTSLYATSTGAQLQGAYFDIPNYIRHVGDPDSLFGFTNNDDFIINVNSGTDQIRVRQNSIIINTDSGTKFAAGATGVVLYSDENGSTTSSKESLLTYDSGIIVKGGAENSFSRGGAVRFYTSTNDGYVGIAGPTQTGSGGNYQILLPNTIGTVGQVLAIASIDGSNAVMQWADSSGGRTCAVTTTIASITPETIPGKNDGSVSIDISGGIADYAVVITHTGGTTKNYSGSSSTIGFTNLLPGTWTITGDDNEPNGATKCPITGTFSVQAGTCSLASTATNIVGATDATLENGSAKVSFTGWLGNVNITITNSDGKYATQTFTGVSTDFTGLGAGQWVITGTDVSNNCTSTAVSFTIPADLSVAIQSTGVNYIPGDVYSMRTTKGTGTGMQITCDADGSNPVIVVAGDGGYESGDDVEANANVTTPASPPDTIATYEVTNLKPA